MVSVCTVTGLRDEEPAASSGAVVEPAPSVALESPTRASFSMKRERKKAHGRVQHTHQPNLRADQHVRHPCSPPGGGLEPSGNRNLPMFVRRRICLCEPTCTFSSDGSRWKRPPVDQSQLLLSCSDECVKSSLPGATCRPMYRFHKSQYLLLVRVNSASK